jgi:hypothetical protein
MKFTRKWSTRSAFFQMCRDDIMAAVSETSGIEPGQPGFLGALQTATSTLLNALGPKELKIYVDAAMEWSRESPPSYVQARCIYLYLRSINLHIDLY